MAKSFKKSRKAEETKTNSEFDIIDDDFESFDDDFDDVDDNPTNDDDVDSMSESVEEDSEQEEDEEETGDSEQDQEEETGDSEEDQEEETEDSEEEEDEEESEKLMEDRKIAEIEELEKEYTELKNEEQDVLRNLKTHKSEDLHKGQAVKNQKALWDKTLELRFLLQKPFTQSNTLPQEPIKSSFIDDEDSVNDAYLDLIDASKKTLDSILELQEVLIENNPSIVQSVDDVNSGKGSKISEDFVENGESDEEWLKIARMQSRMADFRDKSIDKWHRKTQVTSGTAGFKSKLQAFNQNISQQVSLYMRDPSKMVKGMQQNRSAVALFGSSNQEGTNAEADPELLDDSEFYQQLLREFFETVDPKSSETAFYAMKRLQTKKRKIVDRRASKSRKIRYNIHEKIVNFMAPQPVDLPPMATKLFENLFGLQSQKSASIM